MSSDSFLNKKHKHLAKFSFLFATADEKEQFLLNRNSWENKEGFSKINQAFIQSGLLLDFSITDHHLEFHFNYLFKDEQAYLAWAEAVKQLKLFEAHKVPANYPLIKYNGPVA